MIAKARLLLYSYSISDIARNLGVGRTTIYAHMNEIQGKGSLGATGEIQPNANECRTSRTEHGFLPEPSGQAEQEEARDHREEG